MKQPAVLLLTTLAALNLSAIAAPDLTKIPPAAKQEGVTYTKDVRPIFETSCFRCHGEQRPKAGLRLDSLGGVLKGSKEGKVVVPGKGVDSKLVRAVARVDEHSAMPPKPRPGRGGPNAPKDANAPAAKPLTTEQVSLIRAWVDQGAK